MKIKTFAAACKALGRSTEIPDFPGLTPKQRKSFIAEYKLTIITEAYNEGWYPDWKDDDQPKYQLWFRMNPTFELYYVTYHYESSFVPSRLCFKSREIAEYVAKTFIKLLRDYMN